MVSNLCQCVLLLWDVKSYKQLFSRCRFTYLCLTFSWVICGFHTAVDYIRNAPEGMYDAIIVDSSDPIGEQP